MRNQALTGYLLHQRAYQDKRALYYLFTEEFGVIHGVGRRGLPLFESLQLFASGKRTLKNFTQGQLNGSNLPIKGSQQYAGLYLNEILYRLLPVEDPFPELWQQYEQSLAALRGIVNAGELKLILRVFEQCLFISLGYEILLSEDNEGHAINAHQVYRYIPETGFVVQTELVVNDLRATVSSGLDFSGLELLAMQDQGINLALMPQWSRLHRQLVDHLLGYLPLQSRLLWQQQQRYQ